MADETPFIGIDLGTANSVAAYVKDGQAFVVGDENGETVHPSVVGFLPDGRKIVGRRAVDRLLQDPQNTVYSAKRLIGRRFLDPEVQRMRARVGYGITPDGDGMAAVETRAGVMSVQEISAFILSHLKGLAEHQLRTRLDRTVITVPANFHNLQRQATKSAGERAGFKMVRILNEPTAAALSYGFGQGLSQRIAVFDFGAGTLDVTVLNIHENIFEVLSTAGDTALGGDDFDNRLADAMADACLRTHSVDVRQDPITMSRMRRYAEELKCRLSQEDRVTLEVPDIAFDRDGNALSFAVALDRSTFDGRMMDLVERSIRVFEEALRLAKVDAATLIDDTLLVGGTTRIPLVRRRLQAFLDKAPRGDVNPMQAVATGAAIHAATLTASAEDEPAGRGGAEIDAAHRRPVLLDVTPRALGMGIVGGLCEILVQRNTMVPAEETRVFVTSADNQTKVRIPISQGESRQLKENISLGMLELDGLPQRPRGSVKIAVTFEINTDGILEVRAVNKETGKREKVRIVIGEEGTASGLGAGATAGNLAPG